MLESIHGLAASPVATLTAAGHALGRWLLAMNLWTAALLAGALLLDRMLATRARASWRLALYAPVGLRLLLPLTWKIPVTHAPAVVTFLTPRPDGFLPPDFGPAHAPLFTWQAALVVGYVAVALGIAAIRMRARSHLRGELATARPLPRGGAMASAPCSVVEHQELGPMVVGVLRPRIVLPSRMLAPELADQLPCIMGHESAHVRRGDPWLMAALQLATVAFWPVLPVWIAVQRVRALVEMACDEHALGDADASARRRYGHTLLDMAQWRTVTLSPLGAGELHFGSTLRARIEALGSVRRWPRAVQAALVVLAVGGFAACSSVGTEAASTGSQGAPGATTTLKWVPPSRALWNDADLEQYCGPLLESKVTPNHARAWRYRSEVAGGFPAEQVSFCQSPAVHDLVDARNWLVEARDALGQIAKDSATQYETVGYPAGKFDLCPSGPPVPGVLQRPGEKFQTTCATGWNEGAWSCLHFCMDAPMFFQYEYHSDGQHFRATAHGQRRNYLGQVVDVKLMLAGDIVVEHDHVLNIAPTIEETWTVVP